MHQPETCKVRLELQPQGLMSSEFMGHRLVETGNHPMGFKQRISSHLLEELPQQMDVSLRKIGIASCHLQMENPRVARVGMIWPRKSKPPNPGETPKFRSSGLYRLWRIGSEHFRNCLGDKSATLTWFQELIVLNLGVSVAGKIIWNENCEFTIDSSLWIPMSCSQRHLCFATSSESASCLSKLMNLNIMAPNAA